MKRKRRKIIISSFVLLLFLGTASFFGQEDYTRDEYKLRQRYKIANSFFEKGHKYFYEGSYEKAEKQFRSCLKKMPEHADAYFYLSLIYYNMGDIEKSLESIEKAKENYKYIIELKINREQMRIIQLQDRKAELQATQERLKEMLPKVTDRRKQSQINADIGRLGGLIGAVDAELRKPVPTVQREEEIPADYFYRHGNVLFKLKKYQKALEQYLAAVKINPKHGDAYNNLANLYYMDKKYQKALDYLNLAEKYGAKIHPEFKKAILKAINKNP